MKTQMVLSPGSEKDKPFSLPHLYVDGECRSNAPLKDSTPYQYASAKDYQGLLFSFAEGNGPIQTTDLARGGKISERIQKALVDPEVIKVSHNAEFDRICLEKTLGVQLPAKQWRCTMVWCAYAGLPRSLEAAGAALGIKMPKLEIGDKLINLFCKPNAKGCYNLPEDYPQEWEQFKEYNARDVEAVREIWHKLQRYPMPETEWLFYRLDQHINQRGVRIDRPFVEQAILLKDKQREKDLARFQQLTGLSSANSDARMKVWLESKGVHPQNLKESTINTIIPTVSGTVKEALQLRQQLRKNSLAKYQTMLDNANGKDRLQGMFRFYGAHTGRWTSKQVQLQNLPRNRLKNLDAARGSVLRGDSPELITMLYGQPADVLSQLVRTAFIPKDGCVFYVADYAAIEARVLAFFAGETWRMQAFAAGEDIYCSSASQMFGVPVSREGPNSHLRQKGKIAELALGYGGGSAALIRMGALQLGLSKEDVSDLVYRWKKANPHITAFWRTVDQAVQQAIRQKTTVPLGRFTVSYLGEVLAIWLPSGRSLYYRDPTLQKEEKGIRFVYSGSTESGQYTRVHSYGARVVENLCQAASRDLLAGAMVRLEKAGYPIVIHCHDEVVVEAPKSNTALEEICEIMQQTPKWADGLYLRADGYVCSYYQKK